MSLADELLADFEEEGDNHEDNDGEGQMVEMTDVDDVTMETDLNKKNSVRNIAKLRDSEEVRTYTFKKNIYSNFSFI